jgi:hypothetical protein
MVDHPTCIDCGSSAPETDTNYTLISATFGWRLTRRVMPDGSRGVEWRCPKCWSAHKTGQPAGAPAPPVKRLERPLGVAPAAETGAADRADPSPQRRR